MIEPSLEPIEPQGFTPAHLLSALPSIGISGMFLITWIAPRAFGKQMVSYLMLVMLMEFINVHAAGFMGNVIVGDADRAKKAFAIAGLGIFYTLFVGAFSAAFKQWWSLWAFWGLIFNRLLGVLLGKAPTGQEKRMLQTSWAAGVFLYVMLVFATIILPVPSCGITAEVIAEQGFTMGGLWIEEPYRVMAFGFLYFAAVGLAEMLSYKWSFQHGNVGRFFRGNRE